MLLSRALLLKDQPAGSLHTLDELFALAHAMEQEAASRYDELAADMKEQGKEDLAIVFAELAAAEREHVDSVTRWSQSRLGKAPDPAIAGWQAVEAFEPEATIEIKARDGGTHLVMTEQGAFLDGYDDAGSRERGTNFLLDALGASLTD